MQDRIVGVEHVQGQCRVVGWLEAVLAAFWIIYSPVEKAACKHFIQEFKYMSSCMNMYLRAQGRLLDHAHCPQNRWSLLSNWNQNFQKQPLSWLCCIDIIRRYYQRAARQVNLPPNTVCFTYLTASSLRYKTSCIYADYPWQSWGCLQVHMESWWAWAV